MDLWQVVESETSSSSTKRGGVSLLDVLQRLAMHDIADVVQDEMDLCCRR